MSPVAEWWKVDGDNVAQSLQNALEKLSSADGELVLDLSAVIRLQTDALSTLGHIASTAESQKIKVGLRGLSVDAYRVLKLAGLSPRFTLLH